MKKQEFCIKSEGIKFAGIHIIIEFWDSNILESLSKIRSALLAATKAAGANVLSIKLHKFNGGGVSGVVVLSESHISVHTWPEYNYAALDIFTCGKSVKPYKAIPVLKKHFLPVKTQLMDIKRGIIE